MSDMNVDFLDGTYRHEHQRFLSLEAAIDHAELARRQRRNGGK
ncbi:hypothetical protein [Eleftheria terrae]|nr:hypothetical protein [Eleftheria terrae]WKB55304.1 hypothetical protein N7L95_24780 [Eleftheria terrae]